MKVLTNADIHADELDSILRKNRKPRITKTNRVLDPKSCPIAKTDLVNPNDPNYWNTFYHWCTSNAKYSLDRLFMDETDRTYLRNILEPLFKNGNINHAILTRIIEDKVDNKEFFTVEVRIALMKYEELVGAIALPKVVGEHFQLNEHLPFNYLDFDTVYDITDLTI